MTADLSQQEFEKRFSENAYFETTRKGQIQHFPCPFCGARGWYSTLITQFGQNTEPTYCVECDRSARMEFVPVAGGTEMKLIQCGGPEPPGWMDPTPPRDDVDTRPRRRDWGLGERKKRPKRRMPRQRKVKTTRPRKGK